jgi:hypothetical protein
MAHLACIRTPSAPRRSGRTFGDIEWPRFPSCFMVTARLKGIALTAVIIGLVGAVVWQHARIVLLEGQNALLRGQIGRDGSGDGAAKQVDMLSETASPDPSVSLPRELLRELLRLRGEVGVLREQLAEARTGAAAVPEGRVLLDPKVEKEFVELIASWDQKPDQLAVDLAIPEDVARMSAAEGLHDTNRQRYEQYFELKATVDSMHAELEAVRRNTGTQTK